MAPGDVTTYHLRASLKRVTIATASGYYGYMDISRHELGYCFRLQYFPGFSLNLVYTRRYYTPLK